jgi:hypothetical protein
LPPSQQNTELFAFLSSLSFGYAGRTRDLRLIEEDRKRTERGQKEDRNGPDFLVFVFWIQIVIKCRVDPYSE